MYASCHSFLDGCTLIEYVLHYAEYISKEPYSTLPHIACVEYILHYDRICSALCRIYTIERALYSTQTVLDGYCSPLQAVLDCFEVDLGFTELSFIQIDLCVLCDFVLYSRVSLSSCPFLEFCTASPARWECL